MTSQEYMKLAIDLAGRGAGFVNPNPMVGAVIVKNGRIIGQGFHEYFGGPHAEINALQSCTESPEGADLYVTLEPCCHHGKTLPCTNAILKSKIDRVIIGTLDVNPLMSGKSAKLLRQHHIHVDVGILEDECKKLNRAFFKFILTKRPFVIMKYAMTMDGKIATRTGKSQWITGKSAQRRVHQARHAVSAIMVGSNTVIQDNPLLTCRLENGRNPIRIICDTRLQIPLAAQVVQTANAVPTYIATSCKAPEKQRPYEKYGCKFIHVGQRGAHIDLSELMARLGEMGVDSILLEGGGTLNWSALEQHIVDEVHTYIAPKIFGGNASTPVGGNGVSLPEASIMLRPFSFSQIDENYFIESEVSYSCLQES